MSRFLGYAMALLIGVGSGAVMTNGVSANTLTSNNQVAVQHGTDAAFRDGLYMGKHDADEGRLHHVSTGRWSNATDRTQYAAGYNAGFGTDAR